MSSSKRDPVVLWMRQPDPNLHVAPVFVAGYHLPSDVEYRALPANMWNGLIDAVREGATENALMILGALPRDPATGTIPA